MIILDTNVFSALMTEPADARVVSWLDRQPRISIWTTSITGLATMADGRRRKSRLLAFQRLINDTLERRVAGFDQNAAEATATLMGARRAAGTSVDLRDSMIAGIVVSQGAVLATRNIRHFSDIDADVINPWYADKSR